MSKGKITCNSLRILEEEKNIVIDASEIIDLPVYISLVIPKIAEERVDIWIHEFSEISIIEALSKFLPYEVFCKRITVKKGKVLNNSLMSHLLVSLHCISMLDDKKFLYPKDIEKIIF